MTHTHNLASPIVFALDFPNIGSARTAANEVKSAVGMLKIGLELFVEAGREAMQMGEETGLPLFLDLKLHDIPVTVERAVARAGALGARILTVHAAGGPQMLQRAVRRAEADGNGLQITAITLLTSLDKSDLARLGVEASPAEYVQNIAKMAFESGVKSFVCSPHEVAALRQSLGETVQLIAPGVRADGAGGDDDQKRTMTASEAIANGADWVVVGRPIRDASDRLAAASAIRESCRAAQKQRQDARQETLLRQR